MGTIMCCSAVGASARAVFMNFRLPLHGCYWIASININYVVCCSRLLLWSADDGTNTEAVDLLCKITRALDIDYDSVESST